MTYDYEQVATFWREMTERHIEATVPKMVEYGSRDLIELGRDVARLAGRPEPLDVAAYEMGVLFYVRGKMARWFNAAEHQFPVSDDTLDDIIVYATMVKHYREKRLSE